MKESFDLTTTTFGSTRERQYDVVLLPWGATEPHNLHLPYLTDGILSHDIAVDVANEVFEQHGVRCMVMPPVNMGAQNPGQRELPFCIHARYETQKPSDAHCEWAWRKCLQANDTRPLARLSRFPGCQQ